MSYLCDLKETNKQKLKHCLSILKNTNPSEVKNKIINDKFCKIIKNPHSKDENVILIQFSDKR